MPRTVIAQAPRRQSIQSSRNAPLSGKAARLRSGKRKPNLNQDYDGPFQDPRALGSHRVFNNEEGGRSPSGQKPQRHGAAVPDTSQQRNLATRYGREPGENDGWGGHWHSRHYFPKGYTRSDARIREDICEQLADSGMDVRDVSVSVNDGCVRLEGSVHSNRVRHAVEDCAATCLGVKAVENRIRVRHPLEHESGATSIGG